VYAIAKWYPWKNAMHNKSLQLSAKGSFGTVGVVP
jgi:hypothetical protein